MRSIMGIVEAVSECEPATDEELRLTVVALRGFITLFTRSDFEKKSDLALRMHAKHQFEAKFSMMRTDPRKYLGPDGIPGSPGNQQRRKSARGVLAAVEKKLSKGVPHVDAS